MRIGRITRIFMALLAAALTLSGCGGAQKTAALLPAPPEEKIAALTVDQTIDKGMALVVSHGDGSSTGYNLEAIDAVMKKPGRVFIAGFSWEGPDPEQRSLFCLINTGRGMTLTVYSLNSGVFTAKTPEKVEKLIKGQTPDGTVYSAVLTSDPLTKLLTAKEIIAPSSPADCVRLYEEAMMKRNGITQYFLSSKNLRKKFDKTMWVTGVSSPHIKAYSVGKSSASGDKTLVSGTLTWALSGSPDSIDSLIFTVIREENSFRIDDMTAKNTSGD